MFLFARVLQLVIISAKLDHIWGGKGRKTSQNDHFIDAESVRKTFKLATINAILMKLTTIMYPHEIANQKPLKNSVFWLKF